MTTFATLNPANGDTVATFPVMGEQTVRTIVEDGRGAGRWWARLGYAERKAAMRRWRTLIASRMDELADLMHREGGKPIDDALLEITLSVEHIDWAAKHAARVLGRKSVAPGVLMSNYSASIRRVPYGVVGVIGPWNYPIFTPMGSIAYALAAGNAVVFKPSEFTPAVGQWIVESFAEVVPEHPVLQLVTGLGETGAALCASGVDKLAFTGSTATGQKVMAACARSLTPVLVECGGKDVMIIDRDADLEQAAQAAVWGGMANAGQTCVGTERVYAHADVYDEVLDRITAIARGLSAGSDPDASYGPMTMPGQLEVVRRHIDDALARGATARLGGSESVKDPYVDPVVLSGVPEDSAAVQEETFGPVLVVNKVADMDEAIQRANATSFGLAAAVFSRSRAEEVVARLRCGMASVNSVISFAAMPALPFGGVGASGFGRIHGADGLREFTRTQSVARLRVPVPLQLTSFARPKWVVRFAADVVRRRFGA